MLRNISQNYQTTEVDLESQISSRMWQLIGTPKPPKPSNMPSRTFATALLQRSAYCGASAERWVEFGVSRCKWVRQGGGRPAAPLLSVFLAGSEGLGQLGESSVAGMCHSAVELNKDC